MLWFLSLLRILNLNSLVLAFYIDLRLFFVLVAVFTAAGIIVGAETVHVELRVIDHVKGLLV